MQMHRRMHRDVSSDHDLSDQAVVGDMDGSPCVVHGDCPRPCAECTQE